MVDLKKQIVSYITEDNVEKLEFMYFEHKRIFTVSLFKYAVRNNSLKCLEFLISCGYFKEELSLKCVRNNSGNFISVNTLEYLKKIHRFNIATEGEFIVSKIIHSGKLYLLQEYVNFLLPYYFPTIMDFITREFKRFRIDKSEQVIFLRLLTIDNILQ